MRGLLRRRPAAAAAAAAAEAAGGGTGAAACGLLTCPHCGLRLQTLALRCPRCRADIPLGCSGDCTACGKTAGRTAAAS